MVPEVLPCVDPEVGLDWLLDGLGALDFWVLVVVLPDGLAVLELPEGLVLADGPSVL